MPPQQSDRLLDGIHILLHFSAHSIFLSGEASAPHLAITPASRKRRIAGSGDAPLAAENNSDRSEQVECDAEHERRRVAVGEVAYQSEKRRSERIGELVH